MDDERQEMPESHDGVTPVASSAASVGEESVRCSTCGTTIADGASKCDSCGRFAPNNRANLVHEGRSKLTKADIAAHDAMVETLLRERGPVDVVSHQRILDYATCVTHKKKIEKVLNSAGVISTSGQARRSLVEAYQTFANRADRLAEQLPPVRPIESVPVEALTPAELLAVLEHRTEQARALVAHQQQRETSTGLKTLPVEESSEEHTNASVLLSQDWTR